MIELSPERQALLMEAVNIQERMLTGCVEVFKGLRLSKDPEVAVYCDQALAALKKSQDQLEAMIDALNATKH